MTYLETVEEGLEHERLVGRLRRLIDIISRGSWILHLPADWSAIPLPTGVHFRPDDIQAMVDLTESTAHHHLYFVDAEKPLGSRSTIIRLPASYEALMQVNTDWGLNDIALLPAEGDWLMLCSEDDFIVAAGAGEVAERLAGSSRAEALAEFQNYATTWAGGSLKRLVRAAEIDWTTVPGRSIPI